ncbi:MAG: hypothetical protein IKR48_07905 [Kiritimatiellae bacterium]|nr:hypothetical protein [Kiritimatiellia bacterium]
MLRSGDDGDDGDNGDGTAASLTGLATRHVACRLSRVIPAHVADGVLTYNFASRSSDE